MNTQENRPELQRFSLLLPVICCPVNKGPLRLVDAIELSGLLSESERQRMKAGTIGAFVSDTAGRAFPVTDQIADFLAEDALVLQSPAQTTPPAAEKAVAGDDIKRSVKDWYDQFGWKKNSSGTYQDSAMYSENLPAGYGLYKLLAHLSVLEMMTGGDFIIDAASGAIPHPEYLSYSWFYRSRICVDMSSTALEEASAKLRPSDFCCLADICHLPFRDGTMDTGISGYTIMHIPESQQMTAIQELYRVIKPGGRLCLINQIESSSLRTQFVRVLRNLAKPFRPVAPKDEGKAPDAPPHALYCKFREAAWWKAAAKTLTPGYSVETLRLFTKWEFESIFGRSNYAARFLRLVEGLLPRLLLRLSAYSLVVLRKP